MSPRMLSRGAAAFLVLLCGAPAALHATPARSLYESALARDRTVRNALTDQSATQAVILKEIHAVENAYLALVREHPASGYADDALWNAGRLALAAYGRFGNQPDRDTGIRLLKMLAAHYPTSKLARRAPAEIAEAPPASPTESAPPATTAGAVPPRRDADPSVVPPAGRRATITGVTRTVLPEVVRVTIEMDQEMPFHEERIDNPPRVFIDFPSTRAAPALLDRTLRFEADADLVRQIRIGRPVPATTRVVLDAAGVTGYSVYALYNPYRLVIDCARPPAARSTRARATSGAVTAPVVGPHVDAPRAATRSSASRIDATDLLDSLRLETTWGRSLPAVSPAAYPALASARTGDADLDSAVAPIPAAPLTPITPPARNSVGGFSMARQLGLGVSRIVIDPGHGGHDPGAKGKGITEAELVLDVALRLETLLQREPGTEVVLTRRSDEFVPLQERTAIANREGADLFLSIHANASTSPQAHGVETYFLNFASNLSAAAVAARENAASGQAMGALPDFVKAIALNNKLDESRDFASDVQRAMISKLRGTNRSLKDLGVKQAPFVVLIGAAMPSVLAEISFITNPPEAKLLRSPAYRQRIADALYAAIRKYRQSLHAVSRVAAQ